jgi:hypothetical protein
VQSDASASSIFSVLVFLAELLLKVVSAWLLSVVTMLFVAIGPAAGMVGYVAIVRRLQREHPNNPLTQDNWLSLLLAARMTRVVNSYIDTYGVDANVGLTLGGLAITLPGLYIAFVILPDLLGRGGPF